MGMMQRLWELLASKPVSVAFALASVGVALLLFRNWFVRHRTHERLMLRVPSDGREFVLPVDEVTTTSVHRLVEFTSSVREERKRREEEHSTAVHGP
jgi:hypothetical protein